MKKIKQDIFVVIQPDKGTSWASHLFDGFITVLILASVASVFLGTFDLSPAVHHARNVFEAVASIIFTIEYALRIWTADLLFPESRPAVARIRYLVSAMAIIDLVSILPYWLPMFLPGNMLGMRALRLVRLLRILKLNRYFDAVQSIVSVFVSKKRELIGSMFFVLLVMLVSSLLMYSVEHNAQPNVFRNAFSGFWWAVATLTTVGYGDIYPITTIGRILGAVIALSGVAALAIPTGIITSGLMERIGRAAAEAQNAAQESERARQQEKEAERDRLLREQGETLKRILEKLDEH